MFMTHEQNARQRYDIKIVNKLFKYVAKFRYLVPTLQIKK
jgi:hypothetical protein